MELTPIEKALVRAVAKGENFNAADDANKPQSIRADVIRNLYFYGITLNDENDKGTPTLHHVTKHGVKLSGAIITSRLILDGLGRDSQHGAAELHLTHCQLAEGLSLCNGVIAELQLDNITFLSPKETDPLLAPIHLRRAVIHGSLVLNNLRGENDEVPLWVLAKGIEINNGVFIKKSRLYYPSRPEADIDIDDINEYALNFGRAIIKGGISSTSGLKCIGGVTLSDAKIIGTIWFIGSHLIGGEGEPLRGQELNLKGGLVIRPTTEKEEIIPAIVEGGINLWGANITTGVFLSGIEIQRHPEPDRSAPQIASLSLPNATVGAIICTVWTNNKAGAKAFSCVEEISLLNTQVKGDVVFSGSHIGATKNNELLNSINARNTTIDGDLTLTKITHEGQTYPMLADGILIFFAVTVRGSALIRELKIKSEDSGKIFINASKITGYLNIENIDVSQVIECTQSVIDGACNISTKRPSQDGFSKPCQVEINLSYFSVGVSLSINADASNLNLFSARIKRSALLEASVTKNASLAQAHISGDLELRNFSFQKPIEKDGKAETHYLYFNGSKIEGNLKIVLPETEETSDMLITNAWHRPLQCYPDWQVIVVEISRSTGIWYATYLKSPENKEDDKSRLFLCNSRSLIFHRLNEEDKLDISSTKKAIEYTKLFCSCTWGVEGAFSIVESAKILPLELLNKEETAKYPVFDIEDIQAMESLDPETPITESDGDKRHPPKDELYLFKTYVRYSHALFLAYFSLRKNGYLEMIEEQPLLVFQEDVAPEYSPPLRKKSEYFKSQSDLTSTLHTDFQQLSRDEFDDIKKMADKLLKDEIMPHNFSNAKIDLSDANIYGLADNDGAGWGKDVQLHLINFRYKSFSAQNRFSVQRESILKSLKRTIKNTVANSVRYLAKKCLKLGLKNNAQKLMQSRFSVKVPKLKKKNISSRIKQRLEWLELQYPKYDDDEKKTSTIRNVFKKIPYLKKYLPARRFEVDLFESQPYSQAARIFREEGTSDHARVIDYIQRKFSARKQLRNAGINRPFLWVLYFMFNLTSRFGLSPLRTFIFILLFILLGGIMTDVANQKGLLIIDAIPVTPSVKTVNGQSKEAAYAPETIKGKRAGQALCGQTIEPLLYSADIFIPLLDLRQEIRCMIRPSQIQANINPSNTKVKGHYWSVITEKISLKITNNVTIWHWLRSIYSILGWVMVSLFIYTLSQSFKARDTT